MKVLFFAKSREISGLAEQKIELPARLTGREALQTLCELHPGLEAIQRNLVLAVNEEYVDMDGLLELRAADILAVIPPLSGG